MYFKHNFILKIRCLQGRNLHFYSKSSSIGYLHHHSFFFLEENGLLNVYMTTFNIENEFLRITFIVIKNKVFFLIFTCLKSSYREKGRARDREIHHSLVNFPKWLQLTRMRKSECRASDFILVSHRVQGLEPSPTVISDALVGSRIKSGASRIQISTSIGCYQWCKYRTS